MGHQPNLWHGKFWLIADGFSIAPSLLTLCIIIILISDLLQDTSLSNDVHNFQIVSLINRCYQFNIINGWAFLGFWARRASWRRGHQIHSNILLWWFRFPGFIFSLCHFIRSHPNLWNCWLIALMKLLNHFIPRNTFSVYIFCSLSWWQHPQCNCLRRGCTCHTFCAPLQLAGRRPCDKSHQFSMNWIFVYIISDNIIDTKYFKPDISTGFLFLGANLLYELVCPLFIRQHSYSVIQSSGM